MYVCARPSALQIAARPPASASNLRACETWDYLTSPKTGRNLKRGHVNITCLFKTVDMPLQVRFWENGIEHGEATLNLTDPKPFIKHVSKEQDVSIESRPRSCSRLDCSTVPVSKQAADGI